MSKNKTIKIIGTYTSKFGELWDKSIYDLLNESVFGAIKNVSSTFDEQEIEAVFMANMASGIFENQLHLNAAVSQMFKHLPPSIRVEGACASGSLAAVAAENALLSGKYKTVMVVGVEKMTDLNSDEVTKILSSASDFEFEYGSTFPALYALLANAHANKYGTTREQLSAVSVKNHKHALSNKNAQFRKAFSIEQVNSSSMVASPLRLLDCSPVSDGSSAIVLTTKDSPEYVNKPKIVSYGHAQDSLNLANRKSLTSLNATVKASKEAYKNANISAKDIKFAEVHDCFTIAEILAIEDLGFFKKGTGGKATINEQTTYGGKVVINPSGGLKACGHPVGATGVKQLAFMADLLEKLPIARAEKTYGLTHNVGGSGATAVVHILEK